MHKTDLIINADDFGKSPDANRAIIASFERGLCSSTTLMANMPAFDEACELISKYKMVEHVGLHLVLSEGFPLTEKIKKCRRFCDKDGCLYFSREKPTFCLTTSEKEALRQEVTAQIKRLRDCGVAITHADSHHHIHTEYGILQVLIPILKQNNIPYVRLSRNCGRHINLLKQIYKKFLNNKLKHNGLWRTTFFGSIEDYVYFKENFPDSTESFEVMIHPAFDGSDSLVDLPDKPLEELIMSINPHTEIVSYSSHKYK